MPRGRRPGASGTRDPLVEVSPDRLVWSLAPLLQQALSGPIPPAAA